MEPVLASLINPDLQAARMSRWIEATLRRTLTRTDGPAEIEAVDRGTWDPMIQAVIGQFLIWLWKSCESRFHTVLDPAQGGEPMSLRSILGDDRAVVRAFLVSHDLDADLATIVLEAAVQAVLEDGIFEEAIVFSLNDGEGEVPCAMEAYEGGLVVIHLLQFVDMSTEDPEALLQRIAEHPVAFMREVYAAILDGTSVVSSGEFVPVGDAMQVALDRAESYARALVQRWGNWSPAADVMLTPAMTAELPRWRAALTPDLVAACRAAFATIIASLLWDASVPGASGPTAIGTLRRTQVGWYEFVVHPSPGSRLAGRDREQTGGLAIVSIYELMHGLMTQVPEIAPVAKHAQLMVQALCEALAANVLELDGVLASADDQGVVKLDLNLSNS